MMTTTRWGKKMTKISLDEGAKVAVERAAKIEDVSEVIPAALDALQPEV